MTMVTPVLLSGGTGARLWPLSREATPKQLLPLVGSDTLLQGTARRFVDSERFGPIVVVAGAEHRFAVAEQLRAAGAPVSRIVLEPAGRDTAAAAAVAAVLVAQADPGALLLLAPTDHIVGDRAAFLAAVDAARPAAQAGRIVLFGAPPSHAAAEYGYVRLGAPLDGVEPAPGTPAPHEVAEFAEKPGAARAEAFVASGEYVWNSGLVLCSAAMLLEELGRLEPALVSACREAVASAVVDLDFLRLDRPAFERARAVSLDHALLERTGRTAIVPVEMGWSDVGAWSDAWALAAKDADGNVLKGEAVAMDARGCYVSSDGPVVAVSGVEDLVVVASGDAVLVTSRAADHDVRRLVERLKADGHAAATQTVRVHRPWGFYQSIHNGDRFQVKRITVNPGAKLSLQKHFHRAEHWVVVNGTATVTRDDEEIMLRENESVFLPLGCVHRLENPGRIPLNLIEVQSGPYLGEDDIVRIEDIYARV